MYRMFNHIRKCWFSPQKQHLQNDDYYTKTISSDFGRKNIDLPEIVPSIYRLQLSMTRTRAEEHIINFEKIEIFLDE